MTPETGMAPVNRAHSNKGKHRDSADPEPSFSVDNLAVIQEV